jgi:periodic tryptophan protein 2
MATGGYDGKIKLFNSQSGLCFVTFTEHTAPVSALCFTPQGNAILSASQDGSVRAFDLLRYRNFRTFASPDGLCQFASVAVDGGGEIVAASAVGGKYAIYVWSIQTGNVLEVLVGHTSYVQSLKFSSSPAHPGQLVSASWDGSLRVWDLYANASKGGAAESFECSSSVLSVAFDPRGNDLVAAACLSGQVLFWNVSTAQQIGSIEGLRDMQSGRQWKDRFAATHMKGIKPGQGLGKKKTSDGANLNQHFSCVAYVKSGELLLCGSRNSPHLCLYDTTSYSLAMRFTLTSNRSLSGVQVILNSKNMTEQGASWQEFDLSDTDVDDVEVAERKKRIRQANALPGVTVGEAKDAYAERELHVWSVAFSADSQQFAAATTHGVFVYTADTGLGAPSAMSGVFGADAQRFVPQMLTKNVSAPSVLQALEANDLSKALILALALNDCSLIRRVYEAVPARQVPIVVASIGAPLLPALLWFLSSELRPSTGSPHFEFHVNWIQALIDLHFLTLTELSTGKASARTGNSIEAAGASRADVASLCLQLLVELTQRHAAMAKTFDGNTYLLRYLSGAPATGVAEHAGRNGNESDDDFSVPLDFHPAKAQKQAKTVEDSVAFFSGTPKMLQLAELDLEKGNKDDEEALVEEAPVKKKRKKKGSQGSVDSPVVRKRKTR